MMGIGRTSITIANAWPAIWSAELAFVQFELAHQRVYYATDTDERATRLYELTQCRDAIVDVLGMLRSFLDSRAFRAESDVTWN